ncbi:MAG: hypothetical protein ABH804_01330 [archaeon]
MKLFGRKKDVVDLGERYRRQQERTQRIKEDVKTENSSAGGFGFFDTSPEQKGFSGDSESSEERRRKLAKRLTDMTEQLENLSNQLYHLQQRIEVLERKLDVNRFE